MHIPGDDRSELVAGQTGVDLGMNLLAVILGAERWEDQLAVGGDLTQSGNIAHSSAVASDPDNLGHGVATGLALDLGACGVGEVNAVGGFLEEDWSFLVGIWGIGSKTLATTS